MKLALACAVVASIAGVAKGVVVYDAITAANWHSSFFVEDEYADDTTLSTGAGTVIRQVEVGAVRNPGFPGTYSGTMTVRLWADAGGTSGALLGQANAPISLSDNVPHVFAAEFPGVVATTATVWTGVYFSHTTQLGAGLVEGTVAPAVGSSTNLTARHYPDGTWGVVAGPTEFEFLRIDTVPGPGGAAWVGAGVVLLARRERPSRRR